MHNSRILAIGGAYVDINCTDFPLDPTGLPIDREIVGDQYQLEPGGSAVNFARICGRLGLPTTFVGKIGDDPMGRVLVDMLRKEDIEPALIVDSDRNTNLGLNMIDRSGRSIMAVVGNANQALEPDEVIDRAKAALPECSHLFIGGCFKMIKLLPAFEQLADEARKQGVLVVLDHARLHDRVSEEQKNVVKSLALQADIYLPSEDEFTQLWNVESVEAGLRLLAPQKSGVIVVKMGAMGVVTLLDGEIVSVPAFDVKPINIIGAGDSFNAGFIRAQTNGLSVLESMRYGCAVAALKISNSDLPTTSSAEALLGS